LRRQVIIFVRTGSSGASGVPPIAATAASTVGHRPSGDFANMRITAAAIVGGQSVRQPTRSAPAAR